MKKILIALDYNPTAEKVAEKGYALAKVFSAEVTLVHVVTDPSLYVWEYSPVMGYDGFFAAGASTVMTDIRKEAEVYLNVISKHLGNESINKVVLEGDTSEAILEYSKEWGADLIVMGSHSHKGLERFFVSDVSAQVLKHSKIALLTIPTDDK